MEIDYNHFQRDLLGRNQFTMLPCYEAGLTRQSLIFPTTKQNTCFKTKSANELMERISRNLLVAYDWFICVLYIAVLLFFCFLMVCFGFYISFVFAFSSKSCTLCILLGSYLWWETKCRKPSPKFMFYRWSLNNPQTLVCHVSGWIPYKMDFILVCFLIKLVVLFSLIKHPYELFQ